MTADVLMSCDGEAFQALELGERGEKVLRNMLLLIDKHNCGQSAIVFFGPG